MGLIPYRTPVDRYQQKRQKGWKKAREKELTKLLKISLERGRGKSSTMKDLDDNVVMALT